MCVQQVCSPHELRAKCLGSNGEKCTRFMTPMADSTAAKKPSRWSIMANHRTLKYPPSLHESAAVAS